MGKNFSNIIDCIDYRKSLEATERGIFSNDCSSKFDSKNVIKLSGEWENHGGEILMGVSIYDFLADVYSGKSGKLVIIITNKQIASIVGYNSGYVHDNLSGMLLSKIFPDNSFRRGDEETTIMVFGTIYSIDVTIPNNMTFEQYEILSKVVSEVEQFEKDFNVKIPYFYKDKILKLASSKLVSSDFDNREEVFGVVPTISQPKVKSKAMK